MGKHRNRRWGRSACALLMQRQTRRSRESAALARERCSQDLIQVTSDTNLHVLAWRQWWKRGIERHTPLRYCLLKYTLFSQKVLTCENVSFPAGKQ